MDKDTLIKRLMTTFLEELQEHVGALNRGLLALEKAPGETEAEGARAESLSNLFRTAHSLKGAARSVNVGLIESVCHQLEEILTGVRDCQVSLDSELFALLFATADAIEEAGMRLREQADLNEAPLSALLPRLEAAARRTGPSGSGAAIGAKDVEAVLPLSPPSVPVAAPAVPAPAPTPGETLPEPAPGAATVRVPAEKLDALLARSGELLVARRRVQARQGDLQALREFAGRWKAEWRRVESTLAPLLRPNDKKPEQGAALPNGARLAKPFPRRAALALSRTADNLRQLEKDLDLLVTTMAGDNRILDQVASSLDDEVRRARMLPFAEACQGLERMVRDLAQSSGKEIGLVVEGGAVELDRSVLEGLKDPLRHLVRNAVDHGVEAPAERRLAGKPPQARITVAAVLHGAQVEVVVADDGRGLDLPALRQQVRKKGLPEPADDQSLARVIFLPGMSTSRLITDVSGRGMGLDVVKSRIEALHGAVAIAFTKGQGTRFTLSVPLTLTTLRALLLLAGGQVFAIPGTNVQKLVRVEPGSFRAIEGRTMLALGGTPLPVASLAETLGLPSREPAAAGRKLPVLVLAAGETQMGFLVEQFLAEQEIVIKSLGTRIRRVRHVSGATILPSGRIALVLNAANLVASALGQLPSRSPVTTLAQDAAKPKRRILLVEDSVTTRTLEKSILEAAGYEVTVAADGAAGWQLLQEGGADLVVSDVEMPRMDGFALTEAVRRSKRFHDLPVVLVTARETEPDKVRGIDVGANAYLVKSAFDQKNLLETITQLL